LGASKEDVNTMKLDILDQLKTTESKLQADITSNKTASDTAIAELKSDIVAKIDITDKNVVTVVELRFGTDIRVATKPAILTQH